MTTQGKTQLVSSVLSVVVTITVIAIAVLASAGFVRNHELEAAIVKIKWEQDQVNYEMLRKLDCALFDLPRDCRERMAPR
jgi:hypothetical protein